MSEDPKLPLWQCHKRVRAVKIAHVVPHDRDDWRLYPEDQTRKAISVTDYWVRNRKASAPGYFVMYDDGYTSWSPAEAFELGYAHITEGPDGGSRFKKRAHTIDAMRFDGSFDSARQISAWTGGSSTPAIMCGAVLVQQGLRGTHEIHPGDWVVRGIFGEHYGVEGHVFESSYEHVDSEGGTPD